MTFVSVVVTTKNEEANIARCLSSIKAQTHTEMEIIVVDNGSKDRTKEIARTYTSAVYDLGPERSAQRNFGIRQSRGAIVCYFDADMILSPTVLASCVSAMEKNPALVGLYIPERIVGEGFWIKVRDFERSFYDGTVIDAVRAVRRSAFDQMGGFDEALHGSEDWDFDIRLRAIGPTAIADSVLYHHEGRFHLQTYLGKKSYYTDALNKLVAKWGGSHPDIKKQLSLGYRFFGVFLERGKVTKLLAHPILTAAMYWLRFRVGLRYLATKRQLASSLKAPPVTKSSGNSAGDQRSA